MAEDSGSKAFWDDRYVGAKLVDRSADPIAEAALALFGDVAGKRLLDLGCGPGDYSLLFAERGAEVTAVDVSDVAIENLSNVCRERAIENVKPLVCDAFDIARLGPFDLIFGKFILHHLEPFPEFVTVLRSSMVEGGRAFFHENNAMSKALIWCRENLVGKYGIPKFGDDEEFPLTPGEVDELRRCFEVHVDVPETYLLRLASQYLLRKRLMGAATKADALIHDRLPKLRRYSYRQNVTLQVPTSA